MILDFIGVERDVRGKGSGGVGKHLSQHKERPNLQGQGQCQRDNKDRTSGCPG